MARYCSKCNRKIGFFETDFDGMCENCYDELQRQKQLKQQEERKRNLEIQFTSIKNRIVEYIPLMEIYARMTEVYIPLGLYETEYQSCSIILKEVLKKLVEILPENFKKDDIDKINNMETLLYIAEQMNYILKYDYRVNTKLIKSDEYYDSNQQVFYSYIRKKIFYF